MTCAEIWTITIMGLGTTATFAAVVVALWQTKFSNKKRLKLTCTKNAQLFQNRLTNSLERGPDLLSVKIVNTGNREIILTNWGIQFYKDYPLEILDLDGKTFPIKLPIEEFANLQATWTGFLKAVNDNKNKINHPDKIIKIYVFDSTGKKYLCSTRWSLQDILN